MNPIPTGTSILPPSLDFLNCCSKSDTSSDCRSLSPDPEAKDYASHKESVSKGSEPRERNSARHENLSNGVSRKSATCKASSKKHVVSSQTAKKTGSKSQKEVIIFICVHNIYFNNVIITAIQLLLIFVQTLI